MALLQIAGLILIGWWVVRAWKAPAARSLPVPAPPPKKQGSAAAAREVTALRAPTLVPSREASPAPAPRGERDASVEVGTVDVGHFDELTQFVADALEQNPGRSDLYLKLLELYHASGRGTEYRQAAQAFRHYGNASQWQHVAQMGRELTPDLALFHAEAPPTPQTRRFRVVAPRGKRHYEGTGASLLEMRLVEVRRAYARLRHDPAFLHALSRAMSSDVGRPSPLHYAAALSARIGGGQIFFKREDLRPPDGRHRINAIGQALMARFMGKRRIIFGSRNGRSAPALASAAQRLGLGATAYVPASMDHGVRADLAEALKRFGAELAIADGDERRAALVEWAQRGDEALYVTGLKAGPDPYPSMVQDFQAVIGNEIVWQAFERRQEFPGALVCGAAAGADALAFATPGLERASTRIDVVTLQTADLSGARLSREVKALKHFPRVNFVGVTPEAAAEASELCFELEHIMPKPENAPPLAQVINLARTTRATSALVALIAPASG